MKRREFLSTAAVLAAGGSVTNSVRSATPGSVEPLTTPWLRNIESFAIHSKYVGDSFAVGVKQTPVWVQRLLQIPENQPLDLVYVLDGSGVLGLTAAIADTQLASRLKPGFPPLLLVGVDYLANKPNARTRDYTHEDLAVPLVPGDLPPEQTIGGADKFLRFLEEELDPMIRSKYNVSDKPAGILGDSYGGTFTFHAFRRQSKLFDKYFLGSPGLFTTGVDYVGEVAKLLQGKLVHDTRMYLSFGALEMNGGVPIYEDMGRNYNKLVSTLTTANNPQLEFVSKV